MTKALFLVLTIMVVAFGVIWALIALYKHARREEERDWHESQALRRDLREATGDLRYERELDERLDELKTMKSARKGKK